MAPKTTVSPASDPERQLSLGDMVGHALVREFLVRCFAGDPAVESGGLPRSLLLSGPRGVGKMTLAWALTKSIIAGAADPGDDKGAGKVARGSHPDVMLIQPGGAAGLINVDQIRELENWASRYPLEAETKVGIVARAERMNQAAANAFLKLLEEPPDHLKLILVSADAASLMSTIRSRCTPLILEAVPRDELVPWLVDRLGVDESAATLASDLAEGRPGIAIELLSGKRLAERASILQELTTLRQHGFMMVFRIAENLNNMGELSATLQTMLTLLRDALSLNLGSDRVVNRDLEAELRVFAEGLTPEVILETASVLERSMGEARFFFGNQPAMQFIELLVVDMGKILRKK